MSEKRCDVCGAPMLHTNNEMCKNYHLQKEPMTSSSEQPPKEYIIVDSDFDFIWNNINSPLVVRDRINVIKSRSRPHPAPALPNPTCPGCNQIDVADRVLWLQDHDAAIERKAREDDIAALDSLVDTRKSRYEDPSEPEDRKEFLRGMSEGAQMARSLIKNLRTTPHTSVHPPEAQQHIELEDLCNIDLTHYVWGEMEAEDVRQCEGVECNYCGRWNGIVKDEQEAIALLQAGRK